MVSSNLYDLEKYIFLQTEPLEIEVYFEEILLSVSDSFKIGDNLSRFVHTYYRETEIIVETLLEKGAREFFKIRTMANKDYIYNLLLSYRDLLKRVEEIQMKLLENRRKEYIPITISVNSYILNRIATSYEEQFTNNRILVSEAKDNSGVEDAQVRDLQVKMKCLHPTTLTSSELKPNFKILDNVRILTDLDQTKNISSKVKNATLEVLKCSELYNEILEQDFKALLDKWLRGETTEISLPYFNHPNRNITSDWHYKKCNIPRGFEGV